MVRRRHVVAPQPSAEAQPLLQELKRGLYSDDPLDLLMTVSGLVVALEPAPLATAGDEPPTDLRTLVESFLEIDLAPTTAALHVLAVLTEDDLLARRITAVLHERSQPMPRWLRDLGSVVVTGALTCTHPLGDGANQAVGLRLADGGELTALLYVDSILGAVAKDGFMMPASLESVRSRFEETDPDVLVHDADPAETRGAIERAVAAGRMLHPPLESDTWPLSRPLVDWATRLLPPPQEAPREWDQGRTDALAARFLASRHGSGHAGDRGLLDGLLWLGTGYHSGDPLQWSPIRVEALLLDMVPRKIRTDPDELARFPGLLRSFVRFAHHETGVPDHLTDMTLDAVRDCEGEFLARVTEGGDGLLSLLDLLAGRDAGLQETWDAEAVGGPEQLAALDATPLPDEPFEEGGIPADVLDKVRAILHHCEVVTTDLLDVEHRTAARRLLRRLALADPAYLGGRAAAHTHAAAVTWMVAHANDSVGPHADLTAAELLEAFGSRSASQRAAKFRTILGLPEFRAYEGPMRLGSPDLLVSGRRAELLDAHLRRGH